MIYSLVGSEIAVISLYFHFILGFSEIYEMYEL